MCTFSMISDHYTDKWNRPPYISSTQPGNWSGYHPITPHIPSQAEIDEFRALLTRAREYDKRNNEPECDLESKKVILRKLAQEWGIDLSFIEKED